MWLKAPTYESLPQSEPTGGRTLTSTSIFDGISLRRVASWSTTTIALAATNVLTLLALGASLRSGRAVSDASCVSKLSTPSPAFDAIKYLPPAHYKAEFRQTNPWRAGPGEHSDDVDVAWHKIELGAGGIRLTEQEVLALNYTQDKINDPARPLHKVPEEHGGGYLAMLEVFHLLHCLNTLRMGLFYNYDHYKNLDEGVHEENIYTHYDHCIDMLRMQLMCTADVTPALFYDALDNPLRRDGLPDWSSQHTCRDFDAILDWNKNGPRAVRWRDAGSNPVWDPTLAEADPPFPPEHEGGEENHSGGHHHG